MEYIGTLVFMSLGVDLSVGLYVRLENSTFQTYRAEFNIFPCLRVI